MVDIHHGLWLTFAYCTAWSNLVNSKGQKLAMDFFTKRFSLSPEYTMESCDMSIQGQLYFIASPT